MSKDDIKEHIESVIDGETTTKPTGKTCFCGQPVPDDSVTWSPEPSETIEYCSTECKENHREHILDY